MPLGAAAVVRCEPCAVFCVDIKGRLGVRRLGVFVCLAVFAGNVHVCEHSHCQHSYVYSQYLSYVLQLRHFRVLCGC